MKKLVLLAVTAIVIAAVLFFGVKAIKATPKAEDEQKLDASVTTSVSPTATPAPITTVVAVTATPTATPKPAEATPAPTATPTATPEISEATASEATPADAAEAFIESLCDEGTRAEQIPAMAREEKGGFLKSVKLGDPSLTVWTALDLPLGEEPEWAIPTRSGKPIVAGWAYMTRRVATLNNAVPDWYCVDHKAAKLSCEVKAEDYTLYKSVTTAEALKAFRLVRVADGFEWRIALCECGTTETITGGGPGGSSPTKKPTPPPTTPTPPPTKPDHPPFEGVDDSTEGGDNADHGPMEGLTGTPGSDNTDDGNHGFLEGVIGGAESDTNESHGSLEGVGGGDEEPKAKRSSKKSFFND